MTIVLNDRDEASSPDAAAATAETMTTRQGGEQESSRQSQPAAAGLAATAPDVKSDNYASSFWYPSWRGKPAYGGNDEALAWALDSMGRAVTFIGSAAFLGTALLRLAKEAAGCETEADDVTGKVPECYERIYGIRPSSLLTTYTIVVGIVSATLMPVIGAIIDTTDKRLTVGRRSTVVFCALLVPQIAISEKTWFPVAMLQLVIAIIGWAQTLVTYAYLPELTNDDKILNQFSQSFTMVTFSTMVVYLGFVVGVSSVMGWGDIATARFGQSVAVVVASVFLYVSWYILFQPRPAARPRPVIPYWKDGFQQVGRTAKHIYTHWKSVKWFYISIAFIDAGVNSLATVAITYTADVLAFSATENGIAILAMLLGSIPGGITAGIVTAKFDPLRSGLAATLVMLANTIVFGVVLNGPGQQLETYLLAAGWGWGTGWKWTADRLVASTIIPLGQDAELMGTYLFHGQVLTWLPPLLFTVLNEAGVDSQIAVCSLGIWFLFGIAAIFAAGDYRVAVRAAGRGYLLEEQQPEPSTVREDVGGNEESADVKSQGREIQKEGDSFAEDEKATKELEFTMENKG